MNIQTLFTSPLSTAVLSGDLCTLQDLLKTASPFTSDLGVTPLELAVMEYSHRRRGYRPDVQDYGMVVEVLLAKMTPEARHRWMLEQEASEREAVAKLMGLDAEIKRARFMARQGASLTNRFASYLVKVNHLAEGFPHPALRDTLLALAKEEGTFAGNVVAEEVDPEDYDDSTTFEDAVRRNATHVVKTKQRNFIGNKRCFYKKRPKKVAA